MFFLKDSSDEKKSILHYIFFRYVAFAFILGVKKSIRRWAELIGGVFLILLGIVGLVLPFYRESCSLPWALRLFLQHTENGLSHILKKWHHLRERK